MCTEEGCERGPPAPAAPPAHRREGGGGTGEGVRRGWWHRVPVALVEVSPRPLQFGARTPRGSRPSPRRRSQEGAERRPVPRGQFGDSGRARSGFGGSEATPDLPARQRARRQRRGGRDCEQWPFVPRQHPTAPSPVPAPPGSSVPQSMAGEQGGSWLRGGRGSGGAPSGPQPELCCATPWGRGANGAPGQPLPEIWVLLPQQSSAHSAPRRCLAWSGEWGGTKWVPGGLPSPRGHAWSPGLRSPCARPQPWLLSVGPAACLRGARRIFSSSLTTNKFSEA